MLLRVGTWYKANAAPARTSRESAATAQRAALSSRKIALSLAILAALIFSKYFYLASLTSYFTFYLIAKFHVSVRTAQIHLFIFLAAVAAGTVIGGPIGDRIGRKYVIWGSILGVLPFTLALPYVSLFWTAVLTVFIGLILASAFSAILVYAQELVPGRVGTISGLFFGFAFGMGGLGAAVLGQPGGRCRDRLRLPHLLVPAAYRSADDVSAESRAGCTIASISARSARGKLPVRGARVGQYLARRHGAGDHRCHGRLGRQPGEGEFKQRVAAPLGELHEPLDGVEVLAP